MRKKLTGAAVAVLALAAFGFGGTYAGFTDTQETPVLVEGGTLVLGLTDENEAVTESVTFEDLQPGDERHYFVQLRNDGTVDGRAGWAFRDIRNFENGCVQPELDAFDESCGTGPNDGELGSQLFVSFSLLAVASPPCSGAPAVLNPAQFPATGPQPATPGFNTIQAPASPSLVLAPGASRCVRVDVRFAEQPDNNIAQSDSTEFRFVFRLAQA